ncbi:MAG: hypothetical protein ACI9OJ_002831, partial [Myxococcota bacterium]
MAGDAVKLTHLTGQGYRVLNLLDFQQESLSTLVTGCCVRCETGDGDIGEKANESSAV